MAELDDIVDATIALPPAPGSTIVEPSAETLTIAYVSVTVGNTPLNIGSS